MNKRPKLLVSSCLLGQKVRFDGEGKRNNWMLDTLGKEVDFVPVCPEMLMGFGAPRDAMRLHRPVKKGEIEMINSKTQEVITDIAQKAATKALGMVPADIDGVILMTNSPSCGLERVKVYDYNMSPAKTGVGFFAQRVLDNFPQSPIIEVGRLSDPPQRHHFLTRLWVQFSFIGLEHKIASLQNFHACNKYLIMAHAPENVVKMGQIAANSLKNNTNDVFIKYKALLFDSFTKQPALGRLKNAYSHVLGYMKNDMNKEQKAYLQELLEKELDSELDFVKTLRPILFFENQKVQNEYIKDQTIFNPYPKSLEVF